MRWEDYGIILTPGQRAQDSSSQGWWVAVAAPWLAAEPAEPPVPDVAEPAEVAFGAGAVEAESEPETDAEEPGARRRGG